MKHGSVVVVGSYGQLGQAIMKELKYFNLQPQIGLDIQDRFDAADYRAVVHVLLHFAEKPKYVINCAAATNVDLCEIEREYAMEANLQVPYNLAKWCARHGAQLIHVSTDYVFPGFKFVGEQHHYEPCDRPEPLSVYGQTKLLGEQAVQAFLPDALIVRTSGLFGDGHNFIRSIIKRTKESRARLRVVNDEIMRPTFASDLARIIVHMIAMDVQGGIYHATNDGNETTWYGLAQYVMSKLGLRQPVSCSAEEWREKNLKKKKIIARRPDYSILSNRSLEAVGLAMPDWQDAVDRYLPTLKN